MGIVAVDQYNGIGILNALPKFPQIDLKWFRHNTRGKVCIVGRKTYESMPRLKDRHFYVITGDPVGYADTHDLPENVSVVSSLESAVKYARMHAWKQGQTEVMLIGGKTIYDAAVDQRLLDELIVTHVDNNFDCTVLLDRLMSTVQYQWISRNIYNGRHDGESIRIVHYARPNLLPRL